MDKDNDKYFDWFADEINQQMDDTDLNSKI